MTTNNSLNRRSDRFTLTPSGTGAGATGEIRFKELIANGDNHVAFKAPDSLTGDQIYTLPTAYPGSNGLVLASQTDGTLSWASSGGGGGGDGDFVLLDTATTSSATSIDFTGDWSDYAVIRFELVGFKMTTGTARNLALFVSTNSGSTWISGAGAYRGSGLRSTYGATTLVGFTGTSSAGSGGAIISSNLPASASVGHMTGHFNITQHDSAIMTIYSWVLEHNSDTTSGFHEAGGGFNTTAAVVNGVRFALTGSGEFRGTVRLYGIKK